MGRTMASPGRNRYLKVLTAGLVAGTTSIGHASPLDDTHIFRLGAFDQDVEVEGISNRNDLPEISIDFDKVLGVEDSSTTVFGSYHWRFSEKWTLQLYYSELAVDGKKLATKDFNWDGREYTAGLLVDSEFTLDTLLAAFNYALVQDEKKEFGIGVGLHAFNIGSSLGVTAGLGGGGSDNLIEEGTRSSTDLLAPLPNVRAYGAYLLSPRWNTQAAVGWLSVTYDDYDGDYLYFNWQLEYRFTDRFGIGASYQWTNIDFTHTTSRGEKGFDVELSGPSLYLTYGF